MIENFVLIEFVADLTLEIHFLNLVIRRVHNTCR